MYNTFFGVEKRISLHLIESLPFVSIQLYGDGYSHTVKGNPISIEFCGRGNLLPDIFFPLKPFCVSFFFFYRIATLHMLRVKKTAKLRLHTRPGIFTRLKIWCYNTCICIQIHTIFEN